MPVILALRQEHRYEGPKNNLPQIGAVDGMAR